MDYEKLLREKESKMSIWGKESIIEEETLIKSIFVNSVYFSENDFCIDLATSPDYFGGHLLGIAISSETNEMEYDGMNG